MPVSSFRCTRTPGGISSVATHELEVRVARLPDLAVAGGPHDDDARRRELAPELEALGHRRDAERRRARAERRAGDVGGAVPVAVRLDDRPELGAVERAQQRARVAAQRGEIDRELASGASAEDPRQRVDQVARDEPRALRRLDGGALLRDRGGRSGELRLDALREERARRCR